MYGKIKNVRTRTPAAQQPANQPCSLYSIQNKFTAKITLLSLGTKMKFFLVFLRSVQPQIQFNLAFFRLQSKGGDK